MDGSLQREAPATRRIEQYIARMPSLPVTVTRVMEICNSPATSPHDLNRVIALDPVLTGQVLKLVNSAYYGLRNKITSLPRAIIMLGMNTIKNLVVSSAVLNTLSGYDSDQALDMDRFWLHSLSAAVAARWLAATGGVPPEKQEEYFVGGLLHDLGKIPLGNLFPSDYRDALDSAPESGGDLCEKERERLGIDHMQAGGMIAEKWKLGTVLEDCLRFHHESWRVGEQNIRIVRVVSLADLCAKRFGSDSSGSDSAQEDAMSRLLGVLSLADADLGELQDIMSDEIEKAKVFLQVSRG